MKFVFARDESYLPAELKAEYVSRLSGSGAAFFSEIEVGEGYSITADGESIGALFLDGHMLNGFFVRPEKYPLAYAALKAALTELDVTRARILTADSPMVALCCGLWKRTSVRSLCYELASSAPQRTPVFLRCAKQRDCAALSDTGYFRPERLQQLLKKHSVYVCDGDGEMAAFGVIEVSEYMPDYAFVGVAVDRKYRINGIGSSMLSRLSALCSDYGKRALSICESGNTAYAHTLESAGFVCYDKLLEVEF